MSERVLVTGAAGFIGRSVVRILSDRGYDVAALCHRKPLPPELAARCSTVRTGDISDPRVQEESLAEVDAVCHLAAFIPPDFRSSAYAEECFRVNGLGTLALAERACAAGIRRIVYTSAANAYVWLDRPATETDAVLPIETGSYYLLSKFAGEVYLLHACRNAATMAVVLRVGTPYGPGEPESKVVANFLGRALRGEELQVGHGGLPTYNFVYIDDVAQCVEAALSSGDEGIYNVASDESTSLAQLAKTVADVFSENRPSIRIDPPEDASPRGFAPVSIDKARATWDYRPLSLADGIVRYRQEREDKKQAPSPEPQ